MRVNIRWQCEPACPRVALRGPSSLPSLLSCPLPIFLLTPQPQICIGGIFSGSTSFASVAATTCSTNTGTGFDQRCAATRKADYGHFGNARSTVRADVSGSVHLFKIFGLPLAVCCMAMITRLAPVTSPSPRPCQAPFCRDHPVREQTFLVDLECIKHSHVDVATADQAE